jgi:ribosomal protein L37AE/L43A
MTAKYVCPECSRPVPINRFDMKSTMCKTCKAKQAVEKAADDLKTGLAVDLVLGKSDSEKSNDQS